MTGVQTCALPIYYEGLMALHRQIPNEKWLKYAVNWGEYHKWITAGDNAKRHADYQCCGMAYLDMYNLDPTQSIRKDHIKMRIDDMINTSTINDWYWIDAIHMAMPIFAQLGVIENDDKYFRRMYEMYMFTRDKHGGSGKGGGLPLFNENDGLWYRDYQYDPPYTDLTETDKPCYWSRGNGWVYTALARVMEYSPEDVIHKEQYINDYLKMSEALVNCQREDGFWSVSLAAPSNYGSMESTGPETSGTALFTAGLAWGINSGLLTEKKYLNAAVRGWNALCETAVHPNGFLGYVQGAGAKPEDGQPVLFDKAADFEDFGIGCFLLASAEIIRMGDIYENETSVNQDFRNDILIYKDRNNVIIKNPAWSNEKIEVSIFNLNGMKLAESGFDDFSYGIKIKCNTSPCIIIIKSKEGAFTKII